MSFFKNLLDEFTGVIRRIGGSGGTGSFGNSSSSSPCQPDCPTEPIENESICHNPEHLSDWHAHEIHQYQILSRGMECSWIIPIAGNAYLSNCSSEDVPLLNSGKQLTPSGLVEWATSQTKISLYVHCDKPGAYVVAFRLHVPGRNTSRIRVTVMPCQKHGECEVPKANDMSVQGNNDKLYQIISSGKFLVAHPGYLKIDLVGMQKSGPVFANISHAILIPSGENDKNNASDVSSRGKRSVSELSATPHSHLQSESQPLAKASLKFVSDPNDFYFGRRGPSVHLTYMVPQHCESSGEPLSIEYFYNELMVPTGQDVVGAYFCAIGFSGGYFGIQVNSATERRILFSVWSAYSTDNPQDIPEDFKVILLRKGSSDVLTGEFGNEGSGGQSYLKYSWKSSRVYKFIVQAKPIDEDNTMFSAWFCEASENEDEEWRLIASFRKPKISTYLQGLYSFSENFIPEMGHVERYCTFGNQWAWDRTTEKWIEVTKAKFTADATAMKQNRKDVGAGVMEGQNGFYLRNCGFFSDAVEPGRDFCRRDSATSPVVELTNLP